MVFTTLLNATLANATSPRLPQFPALELHPPKAERFVLPNGLTVFLLEDHELPLIKLETLTRAGAQWESPEKRGITMVLAEAMSQGGSSAHTPEEIERFQDTTAAAIAFSGDLESVTGQLNCRTADFNQGFALFSDLLTHPQFRSDFVQLAKEKGTESLRRMTDDPAETARRELRRIIYGPDHPYARVPSPETLSGIQREELLQMHRIYFRPNTTFMAVSGDFDPKALRAKIESTLGGWAKAAVRYPVVPQPKPVTSRQVFYVQRALNQSQIRIGDLGMARHSPDHFAWEVFNELWGGSATSRLFRIVRTQQGLAYSVGSGYSEPQETGLIVAVSQTRAGQTIAATQSILTISSDAARAPFSAEALSTAKDAIINRYIENYASSSQIVNEIMSYDYFGFPPNYLQEYPKEVAKVSLADLTRVGKTYLHPERAKILIMGDVPAFDKPVSALGSAEVWKPLNYSQGAR